MFGYAPLFPVPRTMANGAIVQRWLGQGHGTNRLTNLVPGIKYPFKHSSDLHVDLLWDGHWG